MRKWMLFAIITILITACQESKDQSSSAVASPGSELIELSFKGGDDSLAAFISQYQFIPPVAAFYGVDGSVNVELTVDTNGSIADVRTISEFINTSAIYPADTGDVRATLRNRFALEAERLMWLTEGLWIPEHRGDNYSVSSTVLTLDFKTDQMAANQDAIRNDEELTYGQYSMMSDSSSKDIYFHTGTGLMVREKFKPASRFLQAATNLDERDNDAWFNLGICLLKMDRRPYACQAFLKAARLGDEEAYEMIKANCGQ